MNNIRNFCIIAHIDHGKSTLADRMLEVTGTVEKRAMKAQLLDNMELERERGITIKLQPVRMRWKLSAEQSASLSAAVASQRNVSTSPLPSSPTPRTPSLQKASGFHIQAGVEYELNLIDTPGHVDFSYEVSRSLAACEGAILVVDAAQGIQAQTLANVYLALEANLTIVPVINKIDLPAAEPDRVAHEIANLIGCQPDEVIRISAKDGTNVEQVLSRVIEQVPAPSGDTNRPLRALIFDSVYDEYRGVIMYVRCVDGELRSGQNLQLIGSQASTSTVECGYFKPQKTAQKMLHCGEIGYIVTNLKSIEQARVGDTVTDEKNPAQQSLPGYKKVKPYVYGGFFPSSGEDYQTLKDALEKLKLNDSSLEYSPENSKVLGFGFRLGFLGLLHLEIIKERLEREFGLTLVVTNPSVDYELTLTSGEEQTIKSASDMPEVSKIEEVREPWIAGEIIVPSKYLGSIIQLVVSLRGLQKSLSYIDQDLALVSFEAPLANVLTDFYDQLKSLTAGYGSFNYELADYRAQNLVRLDVLVGGELVDSLSLIVHRSEADRIGRSVTEKLKDVIPRQQFEVSLQAAIGAKVIARETISALRKNVTAKLYGGDVSRKHKLLDKQKKGKAKMKRIGKVDIPPEAFMVLVKKD